MKTIKILAIILPFLFTKNIIAQTEFGQYNYKTAIGIRAGGTSGVTVKQFVGETKAFEGIVGIWNRGLSLTGLYENYTSTTTPGLNWYFGGGAHVSFETGTSYYVHHRYYDYYNNDGGVGFGVDGIVGLEYKISPIPFALSLDIKPFFEVNTNGRVYIALDPGIGIKATF